MISYDTTCLRTHFCVFFRPSKLGAGLHLFEKLTLQPGSPRRKANTRPCAFCLSPFFPLRCGPSTLNTKRVQRFSRPFPLCCVHSRLCTVIRKCDYFHCRETQTHNQGPESFTRIPTEPLNHGCATTPETYKGGNFCQRGHCHQFGYFRSLVFDLKPHSVPAVAKHASDVPDRLRPFGLRIVPGVYRLAHQLHFAFALRNRQRRFPQCPRPSPARTPTQGETCGIFQLEFKGRPQCLKPRKHIFMIYGQL